MIVSVELTEGRISELMEGIVCVVYLLVCFVSDRGRPMARLGVRIMVEWKSSRELTYSRICLLASYRKIRLNSIKA